MSDVSGAVRVRNARGHGGQLREDILRVAMQLLTDSGDEAAVTLRAVARAAGIAPASIYAHFPDVQAIIRELIARAWTDFETAMMTRVARPGTPAERLRAGVGAYLRWSRLNPGLYRVLFTRVHPSRVAAVGEAAGGMFGMLEQLLADEPDKRTQGDTETAATLHTRAVWLWAAMHGIASLMPSHPNFNWPAEDELADQIIDRAYNRPRHHL